MSGEPPKTERNAEILRLAAENPCMSQVEIAARFGVTRQRVEQILRRAGLVRHDPRERLCNQCGKPYHFGGRGDMPYSRFGTVNSSSKYFCSPDCQDAYRDEHNYFDVECDNCGKMTTKEVHDLYPRGTLTNKNRYKGHFFCDRSCFGVWLAKNHGFPAHPDNIRLGLEAQRRKRAEVTEATQA